MELNMSSIRFSMYKCKCFYRKRTIRKILVFGLIFLMIINVIFFLNSIGNNNFKNHDQIIYDDKESIISNNDDIKSSGDTSLYKNPFTTHFNDIWQFFKTNYKTNLNLQIDTYFRSGDKNGAIIDDKVYPVDNLYIYETLLKDQMNALETFENYLALKVSPFWYEDNSNKFNYGFIKSVYNKTSLAADSNRSLVDNLRAILLLINNIGDEINKISVGGKTPKDEIEELFFLINSSQFWDPVNKGFSQYNTTDFTENKNTESNLYAILTLLKLRHLYEELNLDATIKDRAYQLANETMNILIQKMWDATYYGFYYNAKSNWDVVGLSGSTYKYLHVNALGIITLLEYWLETGKNNNSLINKAVNIYQKIDSTMWNGTAGVYQYSKDSSWGTSGENKKIDLEANAIMMIACLKLFEMTGNITYYNKAFTLRNTFENSFYDGSVNAYKSSIYQPNDPGKDFHKNLKLIEAYQTASEIYNSTTLISLFNETSQTPDFLFNKDTLKIDSIYSVKKTNYYYNTSTKSYEPFQLIYNITSADINYIFKFPNGTVLDTTGQKITSEITTLVYDINESLSIGAGYYLYIYANSSIFGTAEILKRFNVVSGFINYSIQGLPHTLYQGPTFNITLPINNTRNENLTLTVIMEGENIIQQVKSVEFKSNILTNVSLSLIAKLGAKTGPETLSIKLKSGNLIYLEVIKTINIGNSFDYETFYYQSIATVGGSIEVSFNLINYLQNSSQQVNVSFSGEYIKDIVNLVSLKAKESKYLLYDLEVNDNIIQDSITITMTLSKGGTVYYSKTFQVQIQPKFEILSVSFPSTVVQGSIAYFILVIKNNQDYAENFSLYVNGQEIKTNLKGLSPGENTIMAELIPSINPYDFGVKTYSFELKDDSGNTIAKYYFEVSLTLSPTNFVAFYLLPIVIPIAIILYYKNKEIKHELLRR